MFPADNPVYARKTRPHLESRPNSTDWYQNLPVGFNYPSLQISQRAEGLLLPCGWTPPLFGDELFLLRISLGMDRLTNANCSAAFVAENI